MSNIKLIKGDCLEQMKNIRDKSIDMILCDLPYGTVRCKWDAIIPFEPLWEQYERIIKDNGAIVLTASQPFTTNLAMSNMRSFRYEWIWDKTRGSNFQLAKKMPMKSHENILVFYKKPPTYNPQYWYSTPYKITEGKRAKTIEGLSNSSAGVKRTATVSDGRRYPLSIIREKRDKEKLHPTQKPVALFEYLIKTYKNEGETVLDNCMGSGTTAIACLNTNRNFIGIEKDDKYFDISCDRINTYIKDNNLIEVDVEIESE